MLCAAFRDQWARTFRCTLPAGHAGLHSGISGPQRQQWSDLAVGSMGQSNPRAGIDPLTQRIAPELTGPEPARVVPLTPERIVRVGPERQPYPSTADLAVPGSAVPPVENQDASVTTDKLHGKTVVQPPYIQPFEHLDE